MEYEDIMHMAITKNMVTGIGDQRLLEEMVRRKGKEYDDAFHDAMVYGTAIAGARAQATPAPDYSMAEIQLTDGTTQTFMMKASTNIVKHLLKEMHGSGYLTMWNDTDVLCIRADQVKQFTLRAFTQQEK